MNKFKNLREEKGFTQQEIANLLSVNQTAVSQWERGVTRPKLQTLRKLAELYDVPASIFIDEETEKEELAKQYIEEDAQIKEAYEIALQLSGSKREEALNYLRYLIQQQEAEKDKE